ncbi:Type II restriction endonuclease EcoO109I [anaerobic digester metagenome]
MPEDLLHEMLAYVLETEGGLSKTRARTLASFFGDIEDFVNVRADEIARVEGIGRKNALILKTAEIDQVLSVARAGLVDPESPVNENYLAAICRVFTRTQLRMIRNLSLGDMNPNPFLIKSLNLHTPEEFVRFNVYALATRSIVTSMGFYVEKFLLASSGSVENGVKPWDLKKEDGQGRIHWVQVKSGPNDMDKDQILYWSDLIERKLAEGDRAYIGITYGKRTNNTITLNHMRTYLADWEDKTLIGRELWDFVADDPRFHEKLFDILIDSARAVLSGDSFCKEIDACVMRITHEFIEKYGDGEAGISMYILEIF